MKFYCKCKSPLPPAKPGGRRLFCDECLRKRKRARDKLWDERNPEKSAAMHRAAMERWRRRQGIQTWEQLQEKRRETMLEKGAKVSELIADGLSTRAIARKLRTTVGTIAGLRLRYQKADQAEA